ncbi:MAG: 16S rRNA (uracil(1498)-N(3))-methyltransferase, partial [Deltaproteobacteria bacterium]
MSRFYVEERIGVGDRTDIKGSEARHIRDVLRLKTSAPVFLFDGSGMEFEGKIAGIGADSVSVDIVAAREVKTESPLEIVIGQGIPKADKMELIVQKSTELGVSRIVPILTERVVPRSFNVNKLERWQRVAIEACKQSGRVKVPKILEPVGFKEFVTNADPSCLRLIPWEGEKGTSLKSALPEILDPAKAMLIIGPEGGLSGSEI